MIYRHRHYKHKIFRKGLIVLRQFLSDFYHDKTFSATLLKIAIPIILQNFISSSLNMIDTIMIGRVGTVELAAVGVATQFFFFNIVILVGICSGYCIFNRPVLGKERSRLYQTIFRTDFGLHFSYRYLVYRCRYFVCRKYHPAVQ